MIQLLHPPRLTASALAQSSLGQRAMIVSLSLSAWGAKRLDRKATREYTRAKKTADDAANVEKFLVPKAALDPVTKAHSRAGDRHRAMTLPWGEGTRILASSAWFDYSQAMAEERANCEREHRKFIEAYPDLIKGQEERLGPLYCASDYPAPEVVAQKFAFRHVVLPVPHEDDFRVSIADDIAEDIRRQIQDTVLSREGEAQRELWERVFKTLRHFATTMAEDGKTFQKTTLTNLAEIATLAPKLSLTADPQLAAICAEILEITESWDAEAIRASKKVRGRAAEDAAAALKRIETAMQGAF